MNKNNSSQDEMQDAFPVIRIGYDYRLLDANLSALPLLGEWNCSKGSKIPEQVMELYPALTEAFTSGYATECKIKFGTLRITFDLIPFPEAGYLGLYGYKIESYTPDPVPQELRMAG